MSDEPDKWTIRNVPRRYQEAVAEAAHRAKVTNGAWLCDAIDEKIRREREPIEVMSPASSPEADMPSDNPIDITAKVVATACRLASTRGVPQAFRQQANATLMACLPRMADPADVTALQPIGRQLPPPDGA